MLHFVQHDKIVGIFAEKQKNSIFGLEKAKNTA